MLLTYSVACLTLFVTLIIIIELSNRIWILKSIFTFVVDLFLDDVRRKLLCELKLEKSIFFNRSREDRLRILEIRPLNGRNFEYYPENVSLICVDPYESFGSFYEKNKNNFEDILLENFCCTQVEDMSEIKDESVDIVVATSVLCWVKDVEKSLSEIKRVLAKGGKFYFLEHVKDPNESIYFYQKLLRPIWSLMFHKCQITRDIGNAIKNAGFNEVIENSYRLPAITFVLQYHIYGTATK
ncbi:methyltransferase-like protein 7A [Centruroides sculpturatus]|uniref:methyltransferase-like protein 7A n=1 Tax=Centruroides sculpturatus TaxID=218467 RepID=UPI000C6E8E7F|nr:methyltransferase-like protein 7A [Centruroides sculpturatus]